MAEEALSQAQVIWREKYAQLRSDPRWTPDAQALLSDAEAYVRAGDTLETPHMLVGLFRIASEDEALTQELNRLGVFHSKVEILSQIGDLPEVSERPNGLSVPPISNRAYEMLTGVLSANPDEQVGVMQIALALVNLDGGIAWSALRRAGS